MFQTKSSFVLYAVKMHSEIKQMVEYPTSFKDTDLRS